MAKPNRAGDEHEVRPYDTWNIRRNRPQVCGALPDSDNLPTRFYEEREKY